MIGRSDSGKIFPGLRTPCGSNACLTRFISAISPGPSSSERKRAFEKPMPCSPLIDPSSETTPSNNSLTARSPRSAAVGSDGSSMTFTWMFPSPAWPKHAIRSPCSRRSRSTSSSSCGTRARGTTTSLFSFFSEIAFSAGESSRRSRHRRSRSSESAARTTSIAPLSRHTRSTRCASSATEDACPSTSMSSTAPTPAGASSPPTYADTAARLSASISSIVAGTTRARSRSFRARTAASALSKSTRTVARHGGSGTSRSTAWVMIASVPSDPTMRRVRS